MTKLKDNNGKSNILDKFSHWVMTHKTLLLVIFVTLIILSIVGNFFVKKESDVISYLDSDTQTKQGLAALEKDFGIIGDFSIGISYVNKATVEKFINKISGENQKKYYINKIVWIGTFDDVTDLPRVVPGITASASQNIVKKMQDKFVLKTERNGEVYETYLISIYFTLPNSADETIAAIDKMEVELKDILSDAISKDKTNSYPSKDPAAFYTFSGSAQNSRSLLKSSVGDMPKFVVVAVIAVFIILFFTTKSYLEPLIFLATLGISILLNMGTNIIAGKNPVGTISSITASCATILQLAVAMDYAIFLMHTYYEELRTTPNPEIALERALPKTIKSVVASSLTTVGSFIALFFMKFGIGYDLGFVLAKGVLLSLITVVCLQPIIIVLFHKLIDKTEHKKWQPLTPRLKFVSKIITKKGVAIPIIVVCLAVVVPAAIFQGKVDLTFITVNQENPNPNVAEEALVSSSNQLILMTPHKWNQYTEHYIFIGEAYKIGYKEAGDTYDAKEQYYYQDPSTRKIVKMYDEFDESDFNYRDELGFSTLYVRDYTKNVITDVFSLCSIFSKSQLLDIDNNASRNLVYSKLHQSFISNALVDGAVNTSGDPQRMLYTMTIDGPKEAKESYATVNAVKALADKTFSGDLYSDCAPTKMTGNVVAAQELSQVTPKDYTLVNILSVVIIFIILLLTFKSFILSTILVLVIETGIWINLSISYFMGVQLHFMAYLIVSAIALGATVDYAILVTSKYLEEKQNGLTGQASIRNAIYRAAPGVLTSGSIFFVACLAVQLISTNMIVKQITALLARNALFSVVLVFTYLPAILSIKERITKFISIKRGKGDPDEGKTDTSIYSVSSKDLEQYKQTHTGELAEATVNIADEDIIVDTPNESEEIIPDTTSSENIEDEKEVFKDEESSDKID